MADDFSRIVSYRRCSNGGVVQYFLHMQVANGALTVTPCALWTKNRVTNREKLPRTIQSK